MASHASGPIESEANSVSLPEPERRQTAPPVQVRPKPTAVSANQSSRSAGVSTVSPPNDGVPDLRFDRPSRASGATTSTVPSQRPAVAADTAHRTAADAPRATASKGAATPSLAYRATSVDVSQPRTLFSGQDTEVRPASVSAYQKIGAPYEQGGLWYIPAYEPDYLETGVASWYGREFHGRKTANGEIFDMEVPTAAHPTLPIPSLVEVTNLENGRAMVVRVNDRGPFVPGRLIDLSARAADRLGFKDKGHANVRVRYVGPAPVEPLVTAETLSPMPGQRPWTKPRTLAASQTAPPPTRPASGATPGRSATTPTPRTQQATAEAAPVGQSPDRLAASSRSDDARRQRIDPNLPLYVQAGVFSSRANAVRAKGELDGLKGLKVVETEGENGRVLYRLVVGPAADREQAQIQIQEVAARGIVGARILALVD